MATNVPFLLILKTALLANSTATVSYAVPPAEDLYLEDMRVASTGAFSITNIRNSNGRPYTNASSATTIPSTLLAFGNTNTQGFTEFSVPLLIAGSETILFDLIDTSGAGNSVSILISCNRLIKVS